MRIHDVTSAVEDGIARVSAVVSFEDRDRTDVVVFHEFATSGPAPEPQVEPVFATAAILADHLGESRLLVETPVDPRLVWNVEGALEVLRSWFPTRRTPLSIETTPRSPATAPPGVAFCLTGGVDSSALLVENHRWFEPGHPMRIDTGLVVYGLDDSTDGDVAAPDKHLRRITDLFGLDLVAVRTNVRELEPTVNAWQYRIQASVLAGAAHAALPGCGHLLVAPSDPLSRLAPYGSHPMLDYRFSTASLHVHHEAVTSGRFERVGALAMNPDLVAALQVCNRERRTWGNALNCGRCEKCVRTMVALRAHGVVDFSSFATPRLTPELVDQVAADHYVHDSVPQSAVALRAAGEIELADSVDRLLRRTRRVRRRVAAKEALREVRRRVRR